MIPLWLIHGGWSLWLLIALFVISISVAVFKLIEFTWFGVANNAGYRQVHTAIDHNNKTLLDKQQPIKQSRFVLNQIMVFAHSQANTYTSKQDFEQLIGGFATAKLEQLRGGLKLLEVISIIAPLLGLLGTVLGMIEAFEQLKSAGTQVDPSILSGGISQALLTTAAGLIVALPALCLWHLFERMLEKSQFQMESALTQLSRNLDFSAQ